MNERFLPIGTIVRLKGGTKQLMITSFCIFPTNAQIKNGQRVAPEKKLFEYGGCPYPEGVLDSNLACAFNHEQIEEILHVGYSTPDHEKLAKILNDGYATFKHAYENGTLPQ